MRLIVLFLALAGVVRADELKPFDKFGRDNVRLEHKTKTSTQYTEKWRTDYGSRGDEKTVRKDLIIAWKNAKAPGTIEAFFVWRNNDGRYIKPAGEKEMKPGDGELSFSETGASSKYKYVALGFSTSDVDKVYGWFVRAVTQDGRIVGALASSEFYLKAAEDPAVLTQLMEKGPH